MCEVDTKGSITVISSYKFGDWSSVAECDKKLTCEVEDRT